MIPLQIHEGQLINNYGKVIQPENGFVSIEIDGKKKRFVFEKLFSYLEKNNQYKKPVLRRNKPRKEQASRITSKEERKPKQNKHRRKAIIISKDGVEQEFESVYKGHLKVGLALCQMFAVLAGKKESLKGYKIKYK